MTKKIRRYISILLAAAMAMTFTPVGSFAASADTGNAASVTLPTTLQFGDINIVENGAVTNESGETWNYDASTNTINITADTELTHLEKCIYSDKDLNINVAEGVTLKSTVTGNYPGYGAIECKENMFIGGTGTIKAISGASIKNSYGVHAGGKMQISGITLNVECNKVNNAYYAIQAKTGELIIENAVVTAPHSCQSGVQTQPCPVKILGNSVVNINSGYYGLRGSEFTFSDQAHVKIKTSRSYIIGNYDTGQLVLADEHTTDYYWRTNPDSVFKDGTTSSCAGEIEYQYNYFEYIGAKHLKYTQNIDGETHKHCCIDECINTATVTESEACSGGTATCIDKAICDYCGEEYGNPLVHSLQKTEYDSPTCIEVGNIEYWTCSRCNKYFGDENCKNEITLADTVISAKGHKYENGKCTVCQAIDPNHTCQGGTATCIKKAVCTICNEKYGDLAGHSWNGGEVTKPATCTEKGITTYTCIIDGCGETKTEDIAMLSHTEETIPAVAATCTATGLTEGRKCSACGKILTVQTVTPIIPHNYENGKCTVCGAVDANHTHTGGTATCQAKAVCTICNEEYGELAGHSWGDGEVTKPATCTEKGITTYTCTVEDCGETKTEDIAMLPHTEEIIPAVAATCTTAGSTAGVKCSRCQTVLTAPEIIPALGHKYGTDWKSDVLNHWHECTVCGDKTDTAAHTEDSGTVTVKPTTESTGTRVYACKECGAMIRDEVIPALDPSHEHEYAATWKYNKNEHWHECICGETSEMSLHVWDSGMPVTAPICTETGVVTYTCTVCGITKTETVNALGHSFTNYIYNNDATCTEDGTETAVCNRCPETATRTAVGSKKGHTEDSGTVTKQPTETEAGVKTFRCTVCGIELRTETIPPIPAEHIHVYGTAWIYDTTSHWHECECGEKADTAIHISDGGTVTKQPTAAETGVKTFSCAVCGYVMNTEIIPVTGMPSTPVTPPYIPSNPTVTTTTAAPSPSKEPFIQGDNGKTGWEAISDTILGTPDGGRVTVNMNSTTKLPKNIISQIQGRDITLVLDMGGGFVWTVNGLNVTKAKTVDMRVRKLSKIPKSAVDEYFGDPKTVQLELSHNGDFGFTAELTIDLGSRYDGLYANSYCYKLRTFESGDSAEIVNGQAKLRFTHASSWLIKISDFPDLEDVSSAAGVHSDGIPINAAQRVNSTADFIFCEVEKLRICRKKRRYRILKK